MERVHCKYLRPNYDQIAAYGCTTTAIPWFRPLVKLLDVNQYSL